MQHEGMWPFMAQKTVDINVGKSRFGKNQTAGGSTSVQLDCEGGKLPFDIAIELPDGRAHAVVRRGRKLPIHQEELFSTASSYQTAMEFHVVYGNRPLAKDCDSIARIRLRNIRWSAAGVPKVTVNFDVNKSGLLTIGVNNLDRKDEAIIETREVSANHAETARAAEKAGAENDAAERARINELDEARELLRRLDDEYHVSKRAMKWGEKREYKRTRKAIADIVAKPLSKTSNSDMAQLRISMEDMRGQKRILDQRKKQVEGWYE